MAKVFKILHEIASSSYAGQLVYPVKDIYLDEELLRYVDSVEYSYRSPYLHKMDGFNFNNHAIADTGNPLADISISLRSNTPITIIDRLTDICNAVKSAGAPVQWYDVYWQALYYVGKWMNGADFNYDSVGRGSGSIQLEVYNVKTTEQ